MLAVISHFSPLLAHHGDHPTLPASTAGVHRRRPPSTATAIIIDDVVILATDPPSTPIMPTTFRCLHATFSRPRPTSGGRRQWCRPRARVVNIGRALSGRSGVAGSMRTRHSRPLAKYGGQWPNRWRTALISDSSHARPSSCWPSARSRVRTDCNMRPAAVTARRCCRCLREQQALHRRAFLARIDA